MRIDRRRVTVVATSGWFEVHGLRGALHVRLWRLSVTLGWDA